jgi:hypothetical protein
MRGGINVKNAAARSHARSWTSSASAQPRKSEEAATARPWRTLRFTIQAPSSKPKSTLASIQEKA